MPEDKKEQRLCKRCGKAPAIDPANKRMVCPDCLRDLLRQKNRIMERIKEKQLINVLRRADDDTGRSD